MDYQTILLAIDIWREDRGQTHASRVGIGWVVKNRVAHPGWWGNTLIQVITHKWQFSSMTAPGDPNLIDWPQENDTPLPVNDAVWADCIEIAQGIVGGTISDPTNGAIEYYTLPLTEPPKSWGPTTELVVIDDVHFCKEAA
jgi:cell wall hydrolase